jgi:hypothetical protein
MRGPASLAVTGSEVPRPEFDRHEEKNMPGVPSATARRSRAPLFGLLLLAPLVGEYLLGNVSIRELPAIPFLIPMYGCGALLIREAARRTGRGWATILVLGAAYGLVEAGLFDGSLFNASFEGLDFTAAYVPALGISASNALHFVVGHAVWSITVPIALVEALASGSRRPTAAPTTAPAAAPTVAPTAPWLGNVGLAVTVAGYVLGGLLIQHDSRASGDFRTSGAQVAGTLAVTAALVAIAFRIGRSHQADNAADDSAAIDSAADDSAADRLAVKPAPRPWLVGVGAFVGSSLFFALADDWTGTVLDVVLVAVAAIVLVRLSRRAGWGDRHRFAVAGGTLLTYAWGGFVVTTVRGRTDAVDFVGNGLFAVAAVVLLLTTAHRARVRP